MTDVELGRAQWDASVYTIGDADLAHRCTTLLADCGEFAQCYRGTLYSRPVPEIAAALRALGKLRSMALQLDGITAAGVAVAADEGSFRDHRARVETTLEAMDDLVQFVELEWLELAPETTQRLLAATDLREYRHYLTVIGTVRDYSLTEDAESALNARDSAANTAWVKLYYQVTTALRPLVQDDRQSLEEARRWLEHHDASLRSHSLSAIYNSLEPVADTLAHCLDTLVADRLSVDALRGLPHPRAERDLINELPSQSVDDMLDVVEQNYALPQRWFTHKAQLLSMDRLRFDDMRAPLGQCPRIAYGKAVQSVIDTFRGFAPWAGDSVCEMFTRGHVDASPRPKKHAGAFCRSRGPGELPSVLLSYFGTVDDVVCLAHELGHALHFTLAGHHRDGLTFDAPLALNEVAPALAELLTYDRLIEEEGDPETRRLLAAKRVESNLETIFLSTFLTRFETRAHQLRAAGSVLTDPRIRSLWAECSQPFYGPNVQMPDRWGLHWALVPHLVHARFYSYTYVFARLVGLILYAMHRRDPEGFPQAFHQLLIRGGSAGPMAQLATLGIDITDPKTWNAGISEVTAMLDPLLN